MYLHFVTFIDTEMVQVVEIVPHGKKQDLFIPQS